MRPGGVRDLGASTSGGGTWGSGEVGVSVIERSGGSLASHTLQDAAPPGRARAQRSVGPVAGRTPASRRPAPGRED